MRYYYMRCFNAHVHQITTSQESAASRMFSKIVTRKELKVFHETVSIYKTWHMTTLCVYHQYNIARENKNDHNNNNNKSDRVDDDSELLGRTILAEKMKFLRVFLPFSHFLIFFSSSLMLLRRRLLTHRVRFVVTNLN